MWLVLCLRHISKARQLPSRWILGATFSAYYAHNKITSIHKCVCSGLSCPISASGDTFRVLSKIKKMTLESLHESINDAKNTIIYHFAESG
jgi:hypothetical protein